MSSRMQRILTGAVAVPIALAVVFFLPAPLVLVAGMVVFGGAGVEYVRLVRHWAPSTPLAVVPVASAVLAGGLYLLQRSAPVLTLASPAQAIPWLLLGFAAVLAVSGLLVLVSPARMGEAMIGAGLIHLGVPYFALPMISIYLLAASDRWLLVLVLVAIWVGDSAAYAVGSRFGRHQMAPVVSPNKTWEGAIAGLVSTILVSVVWSLARQGGVDPGLVLVTALAGAAGQLGDLLESMIKRGVGAKDSSRLLPGHGGLFDRMDAMLLAAPVFVLGLWLLGRDLLPVLR